MGPKSFPGFANVKVTTVSTWNVVDAVRLVLFRQGVLWSDQLSSDCLSSTPDDVQGNARRLAQNWSYLGKRYVFKFNTWGADIQDYKLSIWLSSFFLAGLKAPVYLFLSSSFCSGSPASLESKAGPDSCRHYCSQTANPYRKLSIMIVSHTVFFVDVHQCFTNRYKSKSKYVGQECTTGTEPCKKANSY